MTLSELVGRVLGFLRAGYPNVGAPATNYVPLLALLRRRLSDDETIQVASRLTASGRRPIGGTDIRVAITKVTDGVPSDEDTGRVRQRLVAAGWPVRD